MQNRRQIVIVALGLSVGLAVGLYPATPLAAAGDRVETQTQRTVSCTTEHGALQLSAFATNPTTGSANVTIATGDPQVSTGLLGVSSTLQHYGLDVDRCHSVTKHVVTSRRGLTSAGVVHAGAVRSPTVYC
ncbi:MAG: hypothetical protein ACRDL7_01560, partial [Gaiellaceae bacterium]